MVLSNKKLKQKIREDLVKSLSVSVSQPNPDTVPNLQSQSLKELFDSASHNPRFSKREKRRTTDTLTKDDDNPNDVIKEKESVAEIEKTDNKKRKRDDTVEKTELDEVTKKVEVKTKKQKKKKKKRKVNKTTPKKTKEVIKVEDIKINTEKKEEEDGIVPNKLYVGGIPYQSTEDEIRSYFRTCGVITKVDCIMRSEDGAFTGIAFITFGTEEGANRALAFDRAAMGDRYLTIQQYVKTTPSVPKVRTSTGFVPEMVDGYNRVYIGNLAWDSTERDIRKLFSDFIITTVRLGKNKETGEFKGYAHVDFKDHVSVAMAVKLDQTIVSGRPVKICCALKERPLVDINTTHVEETFDVVVDPPNNEGNYFNATVSTGKVKKRSCYECGEKGHLSTECPKKFPETVNATESYDHDSYTNETYTDNGNLEPTVVTGKVKRRTCYECYEKGHLSTACPKKLQNGYGYDQANAKAVQEPVKEMETYDLEKKKNDDYSYMNEPLVSTGKVKRRNCYECNEKGHISTDCPKKRQKINDQQTVDAEYNGGSYVDATYHHASSDSVIAVTATEGGDDGEKTPVVSVRKLKRRSCYECGGKGHLSSACPMKQQKIE